MGNFIRRNKQLLGKILTITAAVVIVLRYSALLSLGSLEFLQTGPMEISSSKLSLLTERMDELQLDESPSLRVIVLTMDRANSLLRLLTSLNEALYFGHRVDLDIFIDKPEDREIHQVVAGASEEFSWDYGVKTIHYRKENKGLRYQWIHTWNESLKGKLSYETKEKVVILEDDLEVSRFFFLWLMLSHSEYGYRRNVAGFTLQRATLCADNCPSLHGGPKNKTIFGYNLLGSWGFSPTARHWVNFHNWLETYNEQATKPYVKNLTPTHWYKEQEKSGKCPGKTCMWTILHIKYVDSHVDRYTIYANSPFGETLASNYREKGIDFSKNVGRDFKVLRKLATNMFSFPKDLPLIRWNGKLLKFPSVEEAKQIKKQYGNVNIVRIDQIQLFADRLVENVDSGAWKLQETLFVSRNIDTFSFLLEENRRRNSSLNIVYEKNSDDNLQKALKRSNFAYMHTKDI